METDWALGEVLAALDQHQLTENTLVIFTCDNGHAAYTGLPALQEAGHKVSGPLRGLKGDIWEGGHRVPFIARWPGRVLPGAVCDQTISHTNLLATCAEILKAKLPTDAGEDSTSIVPLFGGETTEANTFPAVVHQAANGTLAIRRGKWKLILGAPGPADNPAAGDQLFDLAGDLAESKNIAADQPALAAELAALLQKLIDNGRSTAGGTRNNDIAVPLRIAQPAAAAKKKK
jgi:arylsulfatase A